MSKDRPQSSGIRMLVILSRPTIDRENVKNLTDDADDRKSGSKVRTHPASIFAERALYAERALSASAD